MAHVVRQVARSLILVVICCCTLAVADEPQSPTEPNELWLTLATGNDKKFELFNVRVSGEVGQHITSDEQPLMEPTWSPDGRKIAFVSFRDGSGQIYVYDLSTKDTTNITHTKQYERNPVWSPDGAKILFTSNRDGNQDVFVMNPDGSEPRNLTKNPGYDADPTWSPDGKQIAFASMRDNQPFRLFTMKADGSEQKPLVNTHLNGWVYPSWSPDGKWIACGQYTNNGSVDLLLVNVAERTEKALVKNAGCNSYAGWSPDGRYIAYAHFDVTLPGYSPGEKIDSSLTGGDLMLYDGDSGATTMLLKGGLPTWGTAAVLAANCEVTLDQRQVVEGK